MTNAKFYICKHCGNIVTIIKNSGVPLVCCGEKMEELVANTVEASQEKHLPVVSILGDKVKVEVGSVAHPMLEEHSIQWICLETTKGTQLKKLLPGEAPVAEFTLTNEEPVAVYEYCNLHGLWKTEIK